MMGEVEVGEREKMSGRFCQPKWKQHRLIGAGCVTRSRQVPVGEEHAKNVFGAQLVFSDSVVGLDPVPVQASLDSKYLKRAGVSGRDGEAQIGKRIASPWDCDAAKQQVCCGGRQARWNKKKRHIFVGILRNESCLCLVTEHNVQTQWNIHEHYQRRLTASSRLAVLPLQSRPRLQICEKIQPTF